MSRTGAAGGERVAAAMADRLVHRGPDDSGVWADDEVGVGLGFRRLSIIDLSPAGHQPMVSACGRYALVFNGEIYNHIELRRELDAEGGSPNWRGHSDTETLLAALAVWGLKRTLERCRGMFAFAVWDRRERRLSLARDRMGEKPLYYGWQGNTFLFGSELKALRAHPAFHAEPSHGALCLLLRFNYIPAPYSIYEGISKLPAACSVTVSAEERDPRPEPYWSLQDVALAGQRDPFEGDETAATDELERLLSAAVAAQSVADVPLGALLSGGIDSSTIVALMQARSVGQVRTFTIGFDEKEYDEAAHARAVANHLGTEHTELVLSSQDALSLVPDLPSVYDEPFADSSQLPTQLVMRLARREVTVALSGDGGDELFGGYNRYRLVPLAWSTIGWIPARARSGIGTALLSVSSAQWQRWLGRIGPRIGLAQPGDKLHKLGKRLRTVRSSDDLYFSLVSEWEDPAEVVRGAQEPQSLLSDRSSWPSLDSQVGRMMLMDGATYLPDDILVKVDRASMANSLETRAPFLDRQVVEFAWRLPMALKFRGGKGKWALRQVLLRHLPATLVDRPKMGFGVPLDSWLRGPLRPWAEALLDRHAIATRGFLDPDAVREIWTRHLQGQSYGHRLWSVLMFQSWLQRTQ